MKKILLLALIFCFGFFVPALCEEDFKIPEYTIEIPSVFQNHEDNVKESWLDIEWNVWHANARNSLLKYVSSLKLSNYCLAFSFYVDKNMQISDVVVYFLPGNSFNKWFAYIKKDGTYYAYVLSTNEFYKFKTEKSISIHNSLSLYSTDFIEQMKISTVKQEYVPEANKMITFARQIKALSGSQFLKYPTGSKRYKVRVTGGWQDLFSNGSVYYSSSDFDDKERVKK